MAYQYLPQQPSGFQLQQIYQYTPQEASQYPPRGRPQPQPQPQNIYQSTPQYPPQFQPIPLSYYTTQYQPQYQPQFQPIQTIQPVQPSLYPPQAMPQFQRRNASQNDATDDLSSLFSSLSVTQQPAAVVRPPPPPPSQSPSFSRDTYSLFCNRKSYLPIAPTRTYTYNNRSYTNPNYQTELRAYQALRQKYTDLDTISKKNQDHFLHSGFLLKCTHFLEGILHIPPFPDIPSPPRPDKPNELSLLRDESPSLQRLETYQKNQVNDWIQRRINQATDLALQNQRIRIQIGNRIVNLPSREEEDVLMFRIHTSKSNEWTPLLPGIGFVSGNWRTANLDLTPNHEMLQAHVRGDHIAGGSAYISVHTDLARLTRLAVKTFDRYAQLLVISSKKLKQLGIEPVRTTDHLQSGMGSYATDSHHVIPHWIPLECIEARVSLSRFLRLAETEEELERIVRPRGSDNGPMVSEVRFELEDYLELEREQFGW